MPLSNDGRFQTRRPSQGILRLLIVKDWQLDPPVHWILVPMTTDQTRNVSLTAELNAFIRSQVASGQYQNASEVVRAALRLLQRQEQRGRRKPAAARVDANRWTIGQRPQPVPASSSMVAPWAR